jgi:ATP-binding cassette subfamily B protein
MLKKFISYYKPYKKMFALDLLASFLISFIGMVYPVMTNKILKDYIPNHNIQMIVIFGVVLLGIYLVRMFLKYFVQYYGHVIGVHMQGDMRREMFAKLQKLPFAYYDENETGKIMSRMTNDLQEVSELAHHGPENFFICGITMILAFAYLCYIDFRFALWVICVVPVLLFVSIMFRKKLRRTSLDTRKSVAEINNSVQSSISGIRVTKAFTNEEVEKDKFAQSNKMYITSKSKMYKVMGQFGATTTFVTDLFNVMILLGGGLLVVKTNDVTNYVTFVVSISVFITPLTTLINFVEQYQDGVAGFSRFLEIMNQQEEQDEVGAQDIPTLQGNIQFDHVSFAYNNKKEVLDDVSFKITPGKKIALVGPSGGGKTTICHLIPHFYQIDQGHIYLDNLDINQITYASLRRNIGLVQQDVFLFNGSIKENVLYGKLDASDEEIIAACKKARIHDYIMSLDDGYDTNIGERGIKLSGGQKQRIAIARIFLKNPAILILDEATSALDNATEIEIQKSLDELVVGRTTIVVAHRLSTIRNADEIFYISGGKIKERGTHGELMNLHGKYQKLYQVQFELNEGENND